MTHTKKILACLLALTACGNALQAQETEPRHEMSATLQGLGLGSMPFSGSQSWNDQPGLSLGFGLGYTYWFNEHFGFRTGLRINRMTHNQKITNLDMPFTAALPLSSLGIPGGSSTTSVVMRAGASSIQEEQVYSYIELPLQVAMRFDKIYLNLGVSLAKAVSATADYSYSDPTCAITELPDLGVTPTTPVPMVLTGEKEGSVKNRDMSKPFYFLLAAEAGYNIPVGDATNLSVGLFGRFAPIKNKTDNAVDAYAIQPDATYQLTQPSTSTLVEKVGYYEVGLSVGVNFGLGARKKKADDAAVVMTCNPCDEVEALKERHTRNEAELAALKEKQAKDAAELAALKKDLKEALANAEAGRNAAELQRNAAEAERNAAEASRLAAERAALEKARQTRAEAEKQLKAINATVYFASAGTKAQFDEQTDAAIHAICEAMKADNNLKVIVYGHTDNTGSAKANLKYGRKRAEALKRYMVKLGAPAANINCESKGQEEPIADNGTKEGRALNRRATVTLK